MPISGAKAKASPLRFLGSVNSLRGERGSRIVPTVTYAVVVGAQTAEGVPVEIVFDRDKKLREDERMVHAMHRYGA